MERPSASAAEIAPHDDFLLDGHCDDRIHYSSHNCQFDHQKPRHFLALFLEQHRNVDGYAPNCLAFFLLPSHDC